MRLLTPILLASCVGLAACNPCAERCRVESRSIEDCLDDWSLEWTDFGAETGKDFREQCVVAEKQWIESLEGDERSDETSACWSLVEDLRLASDCEERWEALSSYGGD